MTARGSIALLIAVSLCLACANAEMLMPIKSPGILSVVDHVIQAQGGEGGSVYNPDWCNAYTGDVTLAGFWTFEEGSGTQTVDRSANANNGQLRNGVVWTNWLGLNGALHFDGNDDWVLVPHDASLNFGTGNFTIVSRCKPTGTSSTIFDGLVSKRQTGPQWLIEAGGGRGALTYLFPENYLVATPIDVGDWVTLAFVYDRTNGISIYLDGTARTNLAMGFESFDNTSFLEIGSGNESVVSSIRNFNGDIDYMAIFRRGLSSNEIWSWQINSSTNP